MNYKIKQYNHKAGITEEYFAVRDFFVRLDYAEFTYARWDWMITHGYLDHSGLCKIRLWTVDDQVIGIATYDLRLGTAYCLVLPEYAALKREMLIYSQDHLQGEEGFFVAISNEDVPFQFIASNLGYVATPNTEEDAIFYLDQGTPNLDYSLREGFAITTMEERYDPYEYRRVLWKGFNHELNGEGPLVFSEEERKGVDFEMFRDHVDLSLKIAVVSPDNHFVAYCGMWYEPQLGYAVIEPVATDPDYRKMGLGQAAVLEGIRRVSEKGARYVLVGSNQQFYYNLGMFPYRQATLWKKRTRIE